MTEPEGLPYRPCVGVMLINAEGRVFVGRRADQEGAPEGVGTLVADAARRARRGRRAGDRRPARARRGDRRAQRPLRCQDAELAHLRSPFELLGIAWEGRYRGQKQMWFAAKFEGDESEIDLGPREGHEQEFDAWQWVTMGELPGLIVPFKRKVYVSVVEEFAALVP